MSIPNPVSDHLIGLALVPPTSGHDPAFFNPPSSYDTSGDLGPVIDQARVFIHALLPPWAENHVYRTYAFCLAIAELAGWSREEAKRLGWDKEIWFLTALLHDIGWDAKDNFETKLSFEIFGGIKARELLVRWGGSSGSSRRSLRIDHKAYRQFCFYL